MGRGDHLGNRRHADRIGSEKAQHAYFGRGLIARTRHSRVNTLTERDSLFGSRLRCRLAQAPVVGFAHVREARSQRLVIDSRQGVCARQIDVIGNEHQVARLEGNVDAAGGVRDDKEADPQAAEYPRREGRLRRRIALIEVNPPLQGCDAHALEFAQDQPARVSRGGGGREMRDLAEPDDNALPERTRQGSES